MSKILALLVMAVCSVPLAGASDACPVNLIRGASDGDAITVTFRNVSTLPIRKLEFLCKAMDPKADKAGHAQCREEDTSILPDGEHTVSYAMWGGIQGVVLVSVKSVTFSDGHTWKPSKADTCEKLKILFPDQGQGRTKLR